MKQHVVTDIYRTTVSQEARIVLAPLNPRVRERLGLEPSRTPYEVVAHDPHAQRVRAPNTALRRVQLLVPATPALAVATDVTPEYIGENHIYKMPFIPSGFACEFYLQPDQWLTAMAERGFCELGLVVEYFLREGP